MPVIAAIDGFALGRTIPCGLKKGSPTLIPDENGEKVPHKSMSVVYSYLKELKAPFIAVNIHVFF